MLIVKYVKLIFLIIFILSASSCSKSLNVRSYGFNGTIEKYDGSVNIEKNVDLEPNEIKSKKIIIKNNNFKNKILENSEDRVSLLFLSSATYRFGEKIYDNNNMIKRLKRNVDWDIPSLLDGYYSIPIGIVEINNRKCLLIIHNAKIKYGKYSTISGYLKGYQLVDIDSSLEVELSMKMFADSSDNRILTYLFKRELYQQ